MSDSEHPLVSRLYDPAMALPERLFLPEHREYLADGLEGAVLEVGTGTGAMYPYFARSEVRSPIRAIDPDSTMRAQAENRADDVGIDVDIVDAGATDLPFGDDSFDVVVASLVFCTIPDVEAALGEVARVLRPGGQFRFLEHVRGRGAVGHLHDLVAPCWYHAAGGCNVDRETGDRFLQEDRFDILEYRRFENGMTRFVPLIRGRLERRENGRLGRLL